MLIETVLPLRRFDTDEMLKIVRWIETKNDLAYRSHRKKKQRVAEEMTL
ncbi:MAG: hypothetical protein ACYSTS_19665 [Planctomycetota bacterium]|jgi:hypothetical protein